jgi:hypothetical protein
MALCDNLSVNYEDRPDRGIGACLAETTACLEQSRAHKNLVVMRCRHMQRYRASGIQANWLLVGEDS